MVVPMPARATFSRASLKMRSLASRAASRSLRASDCLSSSVTPSGGLNFASDNIISAMASTAICEATSPAAAPPMPSHTHRSVPRSLCVCRRSLARSRSLSSSLTITKLSSLCSRT
jgi:hypothetical protein